MNTNVLKVLGAVFACAAIATLVGFNKNLFELSLPEIKVVISAGVTALMVFVAAYLDKNYVGFGVGKEVG